MKRFALLTLLATTALAQQQNDTDYTRQIKQFTTGPQFITEMVDHLPASAKVPTPLKFFGYIAGAEGHLTYSEDVNRYMRALEGASPRVKVFSIGKSEEGREMIAVAVGADDTIAHLDRYRDITKRLADPRSLTDADASRLVADGKPIYYITGSIHSPETGSPEMLMELAYRLAVEEAPLVRKIRDNAIVLITPVVEVDGRDRQLDLSRWRDANPNRPVPPLVYWGHYVAHDNNRDNLGLALALSRNVLNAFFAFHPQVLHDLHESVPFMYISTGTGPYNPSIDPLVVDEWQRMAWHEVQELTKRGLPGVWTYGFYDGWAPNYMMWAGQGHNAIGRFYETFGNRFPMTADRVVRGQSDRAWFRPNPPLPTVKWSLRNNINYQQSGILLALSDFADRRQHFLEQFYLLGKRSIAKTANEGPSAWVFDGAQKRQGQLNDLISLLRTHGVEVQQSDAPFSVAVDWPPSAKKEKTDFAKGSFIIRMDQPYSRLADAMLDVQYVRSDEKVYDDTGWTLGYLKNVDFKRVANPDVLKVPMHAWSGAPAAASSNIIENNADTSLPRLVWSDRNTRRLVADELFTVDNKKYAAGTIVNASAAPATKTHELHLPRVAILHTWLRTQDEGWFRLALESLNIPYSYISTQEVSRTPNLREKFDVILFAPTGGSNSSAEIVNGLPPGPPLPWRKTGITPNLGGIDETDDMRPGLGLTGVDSLTRFVEDGGLLITARDTSIWAVQYGLARWIRIIEPQKLRAPGTILLATVTDKKSPIAAGYDDTLPIYYAGAPIFQVGLTPPPAPETRPSGRGGKNDPDVPQGRPFVPLPERPKAAPGEEGFQTPEDAPWNSDYALPRPEDRPRVIVSFAKEVDKLLLSGMLEAGEEIAGKPIVIDSPRGKGHILLFANNPMWRQNTQGSYALVTNAIMNWDHLR
ncbi:MAG TPA: M14 family zinc carboxypeptidase [Thermoanaerobaculia bacterium]|nr:M14 family zinc carboxypeptidase [Thermoanaerobaculia bacterium]